MNTPKSTQELRAVILAGGDGLRLSSLTYRVTGKQIPKQFCPLLGSATLLEDTIHRVSLAFPSRAIITVVTRSQERFYKSALAGVSPETGARSALKPGGTATAILYAPLKHAELNLAAAVAVFPSDHYVSDDRAFMRHVALAVHAVRSLPWTIVRLGAEPAGAGGRLRLDPSGGASDACRANDSHAACPAALGAALTGVGAPASRCGMSVEPSCWWRRCQRYSI